MTSKSGKIKTVACEPLSNVREAPRPSTYDGTIIHSICHRRDTIQSRSHKRSRHCRNPTCNPTENLHISSEECHLRHVHKMSSCQQALLPATLALNDQFPIYLDAQARTLGNVHIPLVIGDWRVGHDGESMPIVGDRRVVQKFHVRGVTP